MAFVKWREIHRFAGKVLGFAKAPETGEAMGERRRNLVFDPKLWWYHALAGSMERARS